MPTKLSRALEAGELGLLSLLIFLAPSYMWRFQIGFLPSNGLEVLVAVFGLIWFINKVFSGKRIYYHSRVLLIFGLILFSGAISVGIAGVSRIALGQFKGFLLEPILVALVTYDICLARNNRFFFRGKAHQISRLLAVSFVASGLAVAGLALGQAFAGQTGGDGRVLSIFQYEVAPSANYLAFYLAPAGALAIALAFLKNSNRFKRAIFYFIFSVIVAGVYFSASRSGLLALLLSLGVGLIVVASSRARKLLLSAVLFVALAGALIISRPNLSAGPDSGRIASSNNIRLEIWRTSWEIITASPSNFLLGVGLGNFQNYFGELTRNRVNYPEFITPRALHPHNLALSLWVNLGLLGLISVLYWFYLAIRVSAKTGKQLPCLLFLVSFLALGLFDVPFFKNDLALVFFLFSVLCLVDIGDRQLRVANSS